MSTDEDKAREYRYVLAGFCTFFAWFWGALAFANLFIINSFYIPFMGECRVVSVYISCNDLGDVRNTEAIVITVALVSMTYLTMTAIFAALSAMLKKP